MTRNKTKASRSERGASATEYVLLLAGIAVLVAAGISAFERSLEDGAILTLAQLDELAARDGGGTHGTRLCKALQRLGIPPRTVDEQARCINLVELDDSPPPGP